MILVALDPSFQDWTGCFTPGAHPVSILMFPGGAVTATFDLHSGHTVVIRVGFSSELGQSISPHKNFLL